MRPFARRDSISMSSKIKIKTLVSLFVNDSFFHFPIEKNRELFDVVAQNGNQMYFCPNRRSSLIQVSFHFSSSA